MLGCYCTHKIAKTKPHLLGLMTLEPAETLVVNDRASNRAI